MRWADWNFDDAFEALADDFANLSDACLGDASCPLVYGSPSVGSTTTPDTPNI